MIKQGGTVTLLKDGEAWRLAPQGYPVDRDKVKGVIEAIEKLALTAMVSESKSYERYDLSDERKVTVKAWAGDTLRLEMEIGKAAPSFQHTFVRLAGDPRVYHARDNLRGRFDQGVDQLRDKVVLSFEKNDIREVALAKEAKKVVLFRKDVPVEVKREQDPAKETPQQPKPETAWETQDGRKVEQEKVDRLLSSLAALRCERYLEDKKKEDMREAAFSVRVVGTQDHTLTIFPKADKDGKGYPAVSTQNDYVFFLPDWQADKIMTGLEDLAMPQAKKEEGKAPATKGLPKAPAAKKQ
jgi:hypothetical protein